MKLRKPTTEDIPACGQIIYDAFRSIADRHQFPYDFPTIESANQMAEMTIGNPEIYGVAAEIDGRIVGSNFLWEFDAIKGVGPITIDPYVQSKGIGRRLMQDVIEHANGAAGIRLVQDSFNSASLSLYASLGFEVVEPLVLIEGVIKSSSSRENGIRVRPLAEKDIETSSALARKVLGYDRKNELKQSVKQFPGFAAERGGKLVGYASAPSVWQLNHAVAESVEDMKAVLAGASSLSSLPLSFLMPTRQAELFRWLLANGMRVVKPMTLMAMGNYQKPEGAFLPSVLY